MALVLNVIGAMLTLPLLVTIAVLIVRMFLRGEPDVGGIVTAVGLALVFFLLAIVFAVIQKFTVDFVVPVMFLRGGKCWAAWKEFYGLLSAHPGQFALYILFSIVLAMGIAMLVLVFMLVTCCFCCLMFVPYLGTVVLLPVLIFKRAYPLYYFAQYGPQYDVFTPPAGSPPVSTSPLPA